ncbi:MAG: alkaline shock response membrane anchor protein AmaP [Carboxydocellales bacterium]
MGWFDRALLTVYSFFIGILSVALFLVVIGWEVPIRIWNGVVQSNPQHILLLIGIAMFFLISVKLLVASLQRRVVSHTMVKANPLGQIHITVEALENMILKTGYQIAGIKELKPRIILADNGTTVVLKAIVFSDMNIPEITDQLQLRVKDYLAEVAGIEVREVKVLVTNITVEGKARARVE